MVRDRLVPQEVAAPAASKMPALLLSNETLDTVMGHVASYAVQAAKGWDEASVSLVRDNQVRTFGPTDKVANEVDQAQYATGEGPCLEAIRKGREQYEESMEETELWSNFSPLAAEKGIERMFSVPLTVEGHSIGALNMYSRSSGPLKEDDKKLLHGFAAEASILLANAYAHYSALELAEHLNEGLLTRGEIGKALGILMAEEGVTSEEAFQRLKRVSQNSNLKLREVAQRLVEALENRNV
jgi:transcriptional regulator with GAF, ATPase, and Fis domain